MMNFDEPINRIGTHSMKWDGMELLYGVSPHEGLSMWVADMDFAPPPAVTAALQARIDHNVYGYFADPSRYNRALEKWLIDRHGFGLSPEWMLNVHGLVQGVSLCLQALTQPNDGVIIFTPVYHAFARTILANGRRVIESPLVNNEGRYEMDLERLQASLTGSEKLLIFCSPHNPGGRVWDGDEIAAVAEFAARNDLIIVSDEIHMDLVFSGHKHHVFGKIADAVRDRLIYLMAASKSFNIAGGLTGTVIAEDEKIRKKLAATALAMGIGANLFGMIASTAAYEGGHAWMDACVAYIEENLQIFNAGMATINGVRPMAMAATYLAWVDFNALDMDMPGLIERVQKRAKIAANHGPSFGTGGAGFMRFNLATTRANVEASVSRLQAAFGDIQ